MMKSSQFKLNEKDDEFNDAAEHLERNVRQISNSVDQIFLLRNLQFQAFLC